MQKSLGN